MKLELIAIVLLWGSIAWAAIEYGWKLAVILLLLVTWILLRAEIDKNKNT